MCQCDAAKLTTLASREILAVFAIFYFVMPQFDPEMKPSCRAPPDKMLFTAETT
jgi:hypothetical protein